MKEKYNIEVIDNDLTKLIDLETEILKELQNYDSDIDKLPSGTSRIVRAKLNELESSTKIHIGSLSKLKEVCKSSRKITKSKQVEDINDVWKLIS